MPQSDTNPLRALINDPRHVVGCHIWGPDAGLALNDLDGATSLGGRLPELQGRSVLVATGDQLTTALALIELDGVARRLVLCPPDLQAIHLPHVIATAELDAVVTGRDNAASFAHCNVPLRVCCKPELIPAHPDVHPRRTTEWVMLTSGTTGVPKMVVHTLAGLLSAIDTAGGRDPTMVWATFYDIRRYGGLQIFFRGLLCARGLVLSSPHESAADHLVRLGECRVTHISGTPSHWRRAS